MDRPSAWSRPAYWEMGLLQPSDWQALWIGSGPATEPRPERSFFQQQKEQSAFSDTVHMNGRSTLLRKAFRIDKPVRSARAYVCGLGYYELYCNGRRVGDQVLDVHIMHLPETVHTGRYSLYVGWYLLDSGERLMVDEADPASDYAVLGPFYFDVGHAPEPEEPFRESGN